MNEMQAISDNSHRNLENFGVENFAPKTKYVGIKTVLFRVAKSNPAPVHGSLQNHLSLLTHFFTIFLCCCPYACGGLVLPLLFCWQYSIHTHRKDKVVNSVVIHGKQTTNRRFFRNCSKRCGFWKFQGRIHFDFRKHQADACKLVFNFNFCSLERIRQFQWSQICLEYMLWFGIRLLIFLEVPETRANPTPKLLKWGENWKNSDNYNFISLLLILIFQCYIKKLSTFLFCFNKY